MNAFLYNLRQFFKSLGTHFSEGFRHFVEDTKLAFNKEHRSSRWLFPLIILLQAAASGLVLCASEYLPNNEAISLAHIIQDYKLEKGANPRIAIYSHVLAATGDDTNYTWPEKSKEVRNLLRKVTCFDFYQADWTSTTSPIVLTGADNSQRNISLLCWPSSNATHNEWLYDMPLLMDCRERSFSPSDLYISKEYANELLRGEGLPEDNFAPLKRKQITVPYSRKASSTSTPTLTNVDYRITGIIDTSSYEYLKYKALFGDFFIANENYSFSFPSQTYFEAPETSDDWIPYFNALLSIYDYKSVLKFTYGSNNSAFAYQYRATIIEGLNDVNSIKNIDVSPSVYQVSTDKVFDAFSNSSFIIFMVVFAVIGIALAIGVGLLTRMLCDKNRPACGSLAFGIYYLLGIVIGAVLGLPVCLLLRTLIPSLSALAFSNPIGAVFVLLLALALVIVFYRFRFIRKLRSTYHV